MNKAAHLKNIESSSSEEYVASSNSGEIGSSSSEDEDGDSSSSEGEECGEGGERCSENSSSSQKEEFLIPCYVPNSEGGCSVGAYVSRSPMPMVGTPKFLSNGPDDILFATYISEDGEGYISFKSNVPIQKKGRKGLSISDEQGRFYDECYYDPNNCRRIGNDLPPKIEEDVYYCVWNWGGISTPMGCTSPLFAVSISITDKLKLRGIVPSNITDEQALEMANGAARTYSKIEVFCKVNGVEKSYGTKNLGNDENRTIENVFNYIKPYFNHCRSLSLSSSSQLSSSSSSETLYSSRKESSSSSKKNEVSSSSMEKRSSSSVNAEMSSSSKFVESSSPQNTCFVYEGSCYKCNPARGSECSNSWLWQGTFTSANIGWWYEQVDCYDPFEEDFDGLCPDKFYLEKSVADNHDYLEMKNYTIEYSVSQKDYDALGRRLNGRRPKFLRSFKKRENKIAPISNNTFDVGNIIYIPIEKMGLFQKFLAKDGEECPEYSCGDLGKDYGVGKDIGVYCGHPCTKLNMEKKGLRIEVTDKRQTGSCGINNPRYTITFKISATTTIKRKNDYYVAPIGYKMGEYVVTKDDYEAVERHEKGHVKSYSCLEEQNMFKSYYEFVLENVCEKNIVCDENDVLKNLASTIIGSMDKKKKNGEKELVSYNDKLWQKMCGWYHKTFSHEDGPGGPGMPATLICPTTNTLLNEEYDLTGCEVH